MKNISKALSILIPIYNEEEIINNTIEKLIQRGFHERYEIVICDDASTDRSVIQAQKIAESYDSISLVINQINGNKIGAIISGLVHIKTPYVLLLDADSMIFETQEESLDNLIRRMQGQNIDAVGFKIRAYATNLLESFQSLEFLLITDGLRRLLKVVACLAGSANLWKVNSLKTVLKQHSGFFEGDDLESTILANSLDFKVVYDDSQVFATTSLKKNIKELFRQRMNIWDVGLIRVFANTPGFMKLRGPNGAFFQSVFITEVMAHPFRILSMIGIFLTFILVLVKGLDFVPHGTLLSDVNNFVQAMLHATSWVYLILWILNVGLIIRALQAPRKILTNGLMLTIYFTFYMATPLVPLITTDFGQMMAITYLWWYSLCAILILFGTELWTVKVRSLLLGFLMPFYFAFLLVFPRSLGFMKYILRRAQGKYTHQSRKVWGEA